MSDYNTLSAAVINDFLAYLNTLANDGVTLNYILSNSETRFNVAKYFDATVYSRDIIPQANTTYSLGSPEARWANLWIQGSTIYLGEANLSSSGTSLSFPDGSTISGVNILANDGATLLTARGNDYTTYLNAQSNDGATLLTARANDYATLLAAQSNDGATLLTARGNDYTTLLAAQANDYATYSALALTIQEDGSNIYTVPSILNFTGNGVTVSSNGSSVTIDIVGGSGGGGGVESNASSNISYSNYSASGSTSVFTTLSPKPSSANNVLVYIDGVIQRPVADYTLDASKNILFTSAPVAGSNVNILQLATGGGSYELPIASNTALGGVIVDGSTITINAAGVISSSGGGGGGVTVGKVVAMSILFGG